MNKTIFNIKTFMFLIVGVVLVSSLTISPLSINQAIAQGTETSGLDQVRTGLDTIAGSGGVGLKVGSGDPDSIITTVGNIVSTLLKFLGVAFLLLIVYAGVKWMFSMGESKKVESAKKIITSASVGLAVVVLSFVIVSFVLNILETGSGGGGGGNCVTCPTTGMVCCGGLTCSPAGQCR